MMSASGSATEGRKLAVKALTVRQPWASLIAIGAKTIETRSWSTNYRGPLLIHAGKRRPPYTRLGRYLVEPWFAHVRHVEDCCCEPDGVDAPCARRSRGRMVLTENEQVVSDLPLGCVVAVAELVDVVPIVGEDTAAPAGATRVLSAGAMWVTEWAREDGDWHEVGNRDDQRPLGDFTPGGFAWLLAISLRLHQPITATGHQGLWRPDDALTSEWPEVMTR